VQAQQRAQQALQQQQTSQAQAQRQAGQAQEQSGQASQQAASAGSASGTTEVTGKIARATASEIQLENNPRPLKIDQGTQVMLNGQTASAEQLSAGTEVRASFRPDSGEARAIRVEATSK